MSFLQKIFGSSNQRELKKMQVHDDHMKLHEEDYKRMEDQEDSYTNVTKKTNIQVDTS